MSGIDVQKLASTYTTFVAAKQALSSGEIRTEEYNALIQFKNASGDQNFYGQGTTVESNPDSGELTDEQRAAKERARQAELAEVEAAKRHVKKDGVTTEEGVITSHGNGTTYTFDIKAPTKHKEKTTKDEERARMARYYDEETGEWIERGEKYKTNKEVRKALKAKEKEIKSEAKAAKKEAKAANKEAKKAREAYAKYDAEIEKLLASGLTMDQIKKDHADLVKNWNDAKAKFEDSEARSMDATARRMDAKEELSQVHQAHTASKRTNFLRKTGVGADKRAYNANVDAQNRLADRVVVRTEAEKDRIKNSPEMKDKDIKVASDKDIQVLKSLSTLARKYMDESSDPKEKAVWQELANLTKKDNDGRLYFDADTKQVQDALIDLTGGDMRLNYTEQQIISKETGMSMSEVRSVFKTYGFEAPNPLGKRVVNGLVAAAPVAATMGLSYLLTKSKSSAEAHAESTAEDHAVADASQTTVVSGEVTAEVEGQRLHFDFPDGSEWNKVIAGKSVTEYYEAVATANAHAEAHSKAFASATAACEAVATLSPAALVAAPALAFLAGFAKKPAEISAVQAGVTTEKMSKFVEVFKHNKNKNVGNQIIQMAGHITGDKAVDRALIVAVLNQDIGSQNTNPTLRELRNALNHLDAIKAEVDKFKKLPPAPPEEPPTPPVEPPTPPVEPPAPPAEPRKVYHADGNITHKVKKGEVLETIVKAKYPGVNPQVAMEAVAKANGLKDKNSLLIDQVLVLPDIGDVRALEDAEVRTVRGGRRIKFNPTRKNGQETGEVYEGPEHRGSHSGETVVDSYTGEGARQRAKKRAEELNNGQK